MQAIPELLKGGDEGVKPPHLEDLGLVLHTVGESLEGIIGRELKSWGKMFALLSLR